MKKHRIVWPIRPAQGFILLQKDTIEINKNTKIK